MLVAFYHNLMRFIRLSMHLCFDNGFFCHSVLSSFSMYFVSFISVYLCVHNYIYVQKIFRFVYKCIFCFVPLLSATIVQSIYMVFVLVLVAVIVRTLAVPLSIIISRLNSYILMCWKKKKTNKPTNQRMEHIYTNQTTRELESALLLLKKKHEQISLSLNIQLLSETFRGPLFPFGWYQMRMIDTQREEKCKTSK